ncbi:hypothetical protein BDV93DRAFT_512063 [Ceratobasidium sp. AG-I]|nr:hypothetical protein BDV93DRAFT_512063 [Ceratobasidium sp. AG-I]
MSYAPGTRSIGMRFGEMKASRGNQHLENIELSLLKSRHPDLPYLSSMDMQDSSLDALRPSQMPCSERLGCVILVQRGLHASSSAATRTLPTTFHQNARRISNLPRIPASSLANLHPFIKSPYKVHPTWLLPFLPLLFAYTDFANPGQRPIGSLGSVHRCIRDEASPLEDVTQHTPVLDMIAKYLRGLWRGQLGCGISEELGRRRLTTHGLYLMRSEEDEKLARKNDGPSLSLGAGDVDGDGLVVHMSQFETGAWQLGDGWVKVARDVDGFVII